MSTGSLGTQKVPAGLESERERRRGRPPERERARGCLVREFAALSRLSFKYGVSACSPTHSAGPEMKLEPEFVFVVGRGGVFCWFGVIFTGCLVTYVYVLHTCVGITASQHRRKMKRY